MEHLKELRINKGLTQQKVALILGCNQTAVGKYERGKLEPNIETLNKLARLFDVTVDYLTGNTDEMGALIQSATTSELSEDEKKLLFWFRNSNEQGRRGIMNTVESLYNALKDASKTATAN